MADIDRDDILVWVYQRQKMGIETGWSDLETYLGPWGSREDTQHLIKRYERLEDHSLRKYMLEQSRIKRCAKQTFMNYKKQLEAIGKLKKKISEKTGRPIYYVPDEFEEEVRAYITRDVIQKLPISVLEKFMLRYKIMVTERIHEEWASRAAIYQHDIYKGK